MPHFRNMGTIIQKLYWKKLLNISLVYFCKIKLSHHGNFKNYWKTLILHRPCCSMLALDEFKLTNK